jgi:beta-glucosidase
VPLTLPDDQVALIKAAAATGKPVIVVLIAGSAVIVEDWIDDVDASLLTFYSGMEGGTALAQLLLGDVSPSGRLPITVARAPQDYPFFDKDAEMITYDLWHGYTKFEHEGLTPRFAFGHGLSYTQFEYRALKAHAAGGIVHLQVSVRNTGNCAGDEAVLVFVAPPGKAAIRPKRLLKAFTRVSLKPGEQKAVQLTVPLSELQWWNPNTRAWELEHGTHTFQVLAADGAAQQIFLEL